MDKAWKQYLAMMLPITAVLIAVAAALPEWRGLVYLFFYAIPANSFIPIPHELGMIYFGQYYDPVLVALVAALGTIAVCFIDYRAVTAAFRLEKLRTVRNSDIYKGAIYYFLKAPFVSVLIAAATPFIPFYIFRVLSPTAGYSLGRYTLAVFLGRLPRYYLFALLGSTLTTPNLAIALTLIVATCALLYTQVSKHLTHKSRAHLQAAPGASVVPELQTVEELVTSY
jgi:membrane protein YqaA with SNARE-associated domain